MTNHKMKRKEIAEKIGKKGMEPGEYRYVAAPAPKDRYTYESHKEHYAKNKGKYVKNVLGKDGKYI